MGHRTADRATTGWWTLALGLVAATLVAAPVGAAPAQAAPGDPTLPPGFSDEVVWDGLSAPTAIRFAPDGRVVVAELTGTLKVYDSVDDETPVVSGQGEGWVRGTPAPLEVRVHTYLDRGLLGLALDPNFPEEPWVYVSYTYNHRPGTQPDAVPAYADDSQHAWDTCPGPGDGGIDCPVGGRVSRMPMAADGSIDTTQEQVLVESGLCFVHPSHTMGALNFGDDGYLYASAGEGASFLEPDTGGTRDDNPCGDAPGEGGSLRSQDAAYGDDPVGLDGSVMRIDPDTGQGAPGNPHAGSDDPNKRRILAHGFRNPFRFAVQPVRPGAPEEVWVGDVGASTHEELNRIAPAAPVDNAGWPCFEGVDRHPDFEDAAVCQRLYGDVGSGAATHTTPWWSYRHNQPALPSGDDACLTGSGSVSAVGFLGDSPYPDLYDGALLVGDYTRRCLWMMPRGPDGVPDRSQVQEFYPDAGHVVAVEPGPGGELWWVEIFTAEGPGAVHRISYDSGNRRPRAVIETDRTSGSAPLSVAFDGSASTDPDGDELTYAWDLDGDGEHDDATDPQVSWTYAQPGRVTASLQVTDPEGAQHTATVEIQPDNDPPEVTIDTPESGTVVFGDTVHFSGHATDPQEGDLTPRAMTWEAEIRHCAPSCHKHPLQVFPETDTGSFTVPDHELPSHILLTATATDSQGLSDSETVRLDLAAPNKPPEMTIDRPEDTTVTIGDRVEFAGHATDPEQGGLPASAIDWEAVIEHCPAEGSCDTETLESFPDTDSGSFTVPDHDLPAHIVLTATATDDRGLTHSDSVRLDVEPDDPPTVEITEPTDGSTYAVGRRVRFAATASDETGTLPPEQVDWRLEAIRCEDGDCSATTVREWTGQLAGAFRPGQQPQDVSLRLVATAEDPSGQTTSDSVELTPQRSRLAFVSRRGRARLVVGGEAARRKLVGDYVVGTRITVRAARRVRVNGRRLSFRRWSHTRQRRHTLVVPARDRRYVARYRR